jgi:hypothetical protein
MICALPSAIAAIGNIRKKANDSTSASGRCGDNYDEFSRERRSP